LLSFIYVYFFESRLFKDLRPIQTKKIPAPRSGCVQRLEFVYLLAGRAAERFRSTGLSSLKIIGPVSALCKKMSHNSGMLHSQTGDSMIDRSAISAAPSRRASVARRHRQGETSVLQLVATSIAPCVLKPLQQPANGESVLLVDRRAAHKKPRAGVRPDAGQKRASLWGANPLAKPTTHEAPCRSMRLAWFMSAPAHLDIVKPRSSL
jgi:hypothetical protein